MKKSTHQTNPGSSSDAPITGLFVHGISGIALIGLAFLLFGRCLGHDLLNWDDDIYLTNNPVIGGWGFSQLRWMFAEFHFGHYHPLTWVSYSFDHLLWNGQSRGYFFTNILLHGINAVLLGRLCRSLEPYLNTKRTGVGMWSIFSWLAVVLFLVHPCRVEVVAWASERKELLAAFFALLSTQAYVSAHQRGQRRLVVWSGVWMFASILSKATAAFLPFMLLLLDIFVLNRRGDQAATNVSQRYRPLLVEKVWHFAAMLAALVFAPLAQSASGAAATLHSLSFFDRLAMMCYSMVYYPWVTLWPVRLSPLYLFDPEMSPLEPRFMLAMTLFAGGLFAVYLLRNRLPLLPMVTAVYLMMVLPVSGLFQSGMQLVADRYTYFPAMLLALCLPGLAARMWQSLGRYFRWGLSGATAVVAVLLSLLTVENVGHWKNDVTLWTQAVRCDRENYVALNSLGSALLRSGDKQAAIVAYEKAYELNTAYETSCVNLGTMYKELGSPQRAESVFRTGLEQSPNNPTLLHGMATLLESRKDYNAALNYSRLACQHGSFHSREKQYLFRDTHARLLFSCGKTAEAVEEYLLLADDCIRGDQGKRAIQFAKSACLASQFRDKRCLQVTLAAADSVGDTKLADECRVLLSRLENTKTMAGHERFPIRK